VVSLFRVTFLASLEILLLALQILHYGLTVPKLPLKPPLSFADLSLEVRDTIYEEIFWDRILVAEASTICRCFPLERRMVPTSLPSILFACKDIRIEAARHVRLGIYETSDFKGIPQLYKDHARAAILHRWNDFDDIPARRLTDITIDIGGLDVCNSMPTEVNRHTRFVLGNQLLTTYNWHGKKGEAVIKTAVEDFECNVVADSPIFWSRMHSCSSRIKRILLIAEYYHGNRLDVSPHGDADGTIRC
jgi:hypothetical protein